MVHLPVKTQKIDHHNLSNQQYAKLQPFGKITLDFKFVNFNNFIS